MRYNKVKLAYLAGLIDGEGYLGVCCSVQKNRPSPKFESVFHITSTTLNLMNWLMANFEGGYVSKDKKRRDPRWKISYKWNLRNRKLEPLLRAVEPYLVIKKKQARLVLEYLESVEVNSRIRLTDTILRHHMNFYNLSKTLNRRGYIANGENSVDTQNGQYRAEPVMEGVTVSPEIMDVSTPLERDDMT